MLWLVSDFDQIDFCNSRIKPFAGAEFLPINQAFQAAQNGETVDFNYTPEQFVEFVQSEDGFKAQKNNQNMKRIISSQIKATHDNNGSL